MSLRFITKTIHAYLDYPVAMALITLPFVLRLGTSHPFSFWLSVLTGVAALVLTIFTDHRLGLFKVVPYSFHLIVDFMVGIVFLVAPLAMGFTGVDAWFYWLNGAAVLTVVGLHQPEASLASCRVAAANL